ncbi:hypothetical protein D623_10003110 [Myotis brandtii]|uniref:Uncharacterized protein n=1 Tax=Myotis brandtii TaxID=109478 RepID=S7NPU2_MYOBR|nr:hypothetical protein D623_10003110 [Myotis brandtii]
MPLLPETFLATIIEETTLLTPYHNFMFMRPVSVDKVLPVCGRRKAMDADAQGIVGDCSASQWTRQDSTRCSTVSHEHPTLSFHAHRAA